MKLIDNAHLWPRLWSVRLAILSAALGALEVSLPLWKTAVEPGTFAAMSTSAAVLAAIARVIKQESLT